MSLSLLNGYDSDSSQGSYSSPAEKKNTELKGPPLPATSSQLDEYAISSQKQNSFPLQMQGGRSSSKLSTPPLNPTTTLPPDLVAEIRRAGHDPSEVTFIDVDATSSMRIANSNDHIPASALRNSATRLAQQISKSRNVGRIARQKHQITALAADALALQAAQAVLPGSTSRRKR